MLPLEAGDDASRVKWATVDSALDLYASHKLWVDTVAAKMRRRQQLAAARRAAAVTLPIVLAAVAVAALAVRRRACA